MREAGGRGGEGAMEVEGGQRHKGREKAMEKVHRSYPTTDVMVKRLLLLLF